MQVSVDTSALESFQRAAAEVARGRSTATQAWARYEQRHRGVFARYLDGWGDSRNRPTAASGMVATAARVAAVRRDWPRLLNDVAIRLTPLVPMEVRVPVVVFVGMGSSTGG